MDYPTITRPFRTLSFIKPTNTAMKQDMMEHQSPCLELLEPRNLPSARHAVSSWRKILAKTTTWLAPASSHFSQKMTFALAGTLLISGTIATAQTTGFEPQEDFTLGDLHQQNGWNVESGSAEVWSNQVFSGTQAARIAPGGQVSTQVPTASPIVTFDSYLQAAPSTAPEIPTIAQLAVLYLDQSGGITGLHGDGNGGGQWVSSGVAIPAGTWFRVNIRLDFTARTWSCSIDGVEILSNLRFHSDHIVAFSTLTVAAQPAGDTLVDQVSVTSEDPPLSLAIRKVGTMLDLSWPLGVKGYRLQTSPTMAPESWQDVTTMDNKTNHPIDQPSRFFRLTGP